MATCVWPLLLTCVCTIGWAQVTPEDIPMSAAARGTIPDRFEPTTADQIRALLRVPQPFELRTLAILPPPPGLVAAKTLRHQVPKDAQRNYDNGVKALQKGDYARATELLQQAVALDGEFALAHSNLGVALVRQNKLAEAEPAIRRALALDLYVPNAHSNLAWVLAGLGRPAEAEPFARRALEIDPDNQSARKLLSAVEEALAPKNEPRP